MATQLEKNATNLETILNKVKKIPNNWYPKSEIDTITDNIATAIEGKGVDVPSGTALVDMPAMINSITVDDGSLRGIIERTAVNPTLPDDLTKIGSSAFREYSSLALTSLPDGVTEIGSYAFYYCSSLALTSLPDGVTIIGNNSLQGCHSLALTSLPAGVTTIYSYAFGSCSGLTTITFNGTPTSISDTAFYNCTNLTTINVPWAEGEVENAPWGATNATINYNYTGE